MWGQSFSSWLWVHLHVYVTLCENLDILTKWPDDVSYSVMQSVTDISQERLFFFHLVLSFRTSLPFALNIHVTQHVSRTARHDVKKSWRGLDPVEHCIIESQLQWTCNICKMRTMSTDQCWLHCVDWRLHRFHRTTRQSDWTSTHTSCRTKARVFGQILEEIGTDSSETKGRRSRCWQLCTRIE